MRYEAKHSYFKQLAVSMGNCTNLPYSLAMRHQQLRCCLNASKTNLSEVNVGPGMCDDVFFLSFSYYYATSGSVIIPDKLKEQLPFSISHAFE